MRGYERCLVLGGARSGKSSYAVARCEAFPPPRAYLATAEPGDAEMAERIARHRAARAAAWYTIEEPLQVAAALQEQQGRCTVLLLDCLTLWLSNLMERGLEDATILQRLEEALAALGTLLCHVILVSNEVGWGIVPAHPYGRRFRDLAGRANQIAAAALDEVVLIVAGQPLCLKPAGGSTSR
ncbi:MAG: bifunctional adenosylcobinamide kinase/adenosylcobinamide-phosphate guanylyltransferase [Candidatus Tectomicrobia bacterium]|nr:bifunctional adenosylcobinamide kinase/adenosylcobinamide-phosphate guanylyltransferase [Candidatus Tectomicrobia bacterium]